jgi:hypothetical protein
MAFVRMCILNWACKACGKEFTRKDVLLSFNNE